MAKARKTTKKKTTLRVAAKVADKKKLEASADEREFGPLWGLWLGGKGDRPGLWFAPNGCVFSSYDKRVALAASYNFTIAQSWSPSIRQIGADGQPL